MSATVPNNLFNVRLKVRRVTGRPSPNQLSDQEIDNYINTFYLYDMPEHLRLESLRFNYQFVTSENVPVYDLPTNVYLTNMPPVYIAGYQSYMTQSRENFFRVNPQLNFLQQSINTGNGTAGPYTATLTQTPITPGFKPNPPGAFSTSPIKASYINWNMLISAIDASNISRCLVDDGQGNLINPGDPNDPQTQPNFGGPAPVVCGSINYLTGAVAITNFIDNTVSHNPVSIPSGNPINAQYIPYVASRPQSVVFYQDQFYLYPIPDQAYTVSFEAYKYPAAFLNDSAGISTPQLNEWWQLLAYGAADKIFADNADFDNLQKFRPLLKEQMDLIQRRTIVQQTSERTATIYTEQAAFQQFPFGNMFG